MSPMRRGRNKGAGSASERQDRGLDSRDALGRGGPYVHYRPRRFGDLGDRKTGLRGREVEVERYDGGFSGWQLLNRLPVVAGVGEACVLGGDLDGEAYVREILASHVLNPQVEPLLRKRREGRQRAFPQV